MKHTIIQITAWLIASGLSFSVFITSHHLLSTHLKNNEPAGEEQSNDDDNDDSETPTVLEHASTPATEPL